MLTSPNKDETAVHCCDPAISVLVMLVSRNPFSRSISLAVLFVFTFFQLIRSLVDPMLAALIVCGPLQYLGSNGPYGEVTPERVPFSGMKRHDIHKLQCDYFNQGHPTKLSTNLTNKTRGG